MKTRSGLMACLLLFVCGGIVAGSRPVAAQTATPQPATLTVFGDGLAPGWQNYSWGSQVSVDATVPDDSSARAIGFEVTDPYGALHLHADAPIETGPYAALQLALRATHPNQVYTVVLYDAQGSQIGMPVPLGRYGVDPVVEAWTMYTVPLGAADLNAAGKQISGIVLQGDSGAPQPLIYVANVRFVDKLTANAVTTTSKAAPRGSSSSKDWFLPMLTGVVIGLAALMALLGARRAKTALFA